MAELRDKIADAMRYGILLHVNHPEAASLADDGAGDVMGIVGPVLDGWRRRALTAETAIDRFRRRHTPHDCAQHVFARTPTPCVNAGLCRCGCPLPCRELAEFDGKEATDA